MPLGGLLEIEAAVGKVQSGKFCSWQRRQHTAERKTRDGRAERSGAEGSGVEQSNQGRIIRNEVLIKSIQIRAQNRVL